MYYCKNSLLQMMLTSYVNYYVLHGHADAVIGDIQLVPTADIDHFEVQVYYGDGLNPASWVGICHDHSYLVQNVTCRQLGYKAAEHSSFISV